MTTAAISQCSQRGRSGEMFMHVIVVRGSHDFE